jgi:hypothetical protein
MSGQEDNVDDNNEENNEENYDNKLSLIDRFISMSLDDKKQFDIDYKNALEDLKCENENQQYELQDGKLHNMNNGVELNKDQKSLDLRKKMSLSMSQKNDDNGVDKKNDDNDVDKKIKNPELNRTKFAPKKCKNANISKEDELKLEIKRIKANIRYYDKRNVAYPAQLFERCNKIGYVIPKK